MNRPETSRRLRRLDADAAFLAVVIGAMDASGHVSATEAARAHDILWATRRFRHRDGDEVGLEIERTKTLIEQHDGVAQYVEHGLQTASRLLGPDRG